MVVVVVVVDCPTRAQLDVSSPIGRKGVKNDAQPVVTSIPRHIAGCRGEPTMAHRNNPPSPPKRGVRTHATHVATAQQSHGDVFMQRNQSEGNQQRAKSLSSMSPPLPLPPSQLDGQRL